MYCIAVNILRHTYLYVNKKESIDIQYRVCMYTDRNMCKNCSI